MYVNGIKADEVRANSNINDIENFVFGRDHFDGGIRYFDGTIYDIKIWNTARTQLELLTTPKYLPRNNAGLLGHWSFEEGEGNIVFDKTKNGNHANIVNGMWVVE